MRVFLHELRKLLRSAPLFASLLVLFLFQGTSITYYLRTLPEQSEYTQSLALFVGWRERYGLTLEPEELPGLEAELAGLIAEADETIANWDGTIWAQYGKFSDAGITNYAEYVSLLEQVNRDNEQNAVAALLLDSRTDFLHYRIQTVKNILENYDFEQTGDLFTAASALGGDHTADSQAVARCAEIAGDPSMTHSIFYYFLTNAASQFAIQLTVISLLAVSLLVSPQLVRERLSRMAQEQWPTRTGRRVLRYQLAAALMVSAAVPISLLAVFGTWFCRSWHAGVFWDCTAYAVGGSPIPWFTFTYGQYLCFLAAMVVALGVVAGALMFFLSRFSGNYVAMLLKALPMFLLLSYFAEKILSNALYFGNDVSGATGIPGAEPLVAALLLAGAVLVNLWTVHAERSRELP